jgi:hypothetical protein
MSRPDAPSLVALLAELDRLRALTAGLLDRSAPATPPVAPADGPAETLHDLLVAARRAVLEHPAGAKRLYDLLVAQGRRYADTPAGAELRDALVASPAVAHLRRVWELVTLNVLDGPADPGGVPDAWAELLVDAATAGELDESVLRRLRPDGSG